MSQIIDVLKKRPFMVALVAGFLLWKIPDYDTSNLTWFSDGNIWWNLAIFAAIAAFVVGAYKDRNGSSTGARWFFRGVMAVAVVYGVLYFTMGPRWAADMLGTEAFTVQNDPERDVLAGDPEYMMYQSLSGRWVRAAGIDGELLHPKDCRKQYEARQADGEIALQPYPHRSQDGSVYDYANQGICVSPIDGVTRMIPWDPVKAEALPSLYTAAKEKVGSVTGAIGSVFKDEDKPAVIEGTSIEHKGGIPYHQLTERKQAFILRPGQLLNVEGFRYGCISIPEETSSQMLQKKDSIRWTRTFRLKPGVDTLQFTAWVIPAGETDMYGRTCPTITEQGIL